MRRSTTSEEKALVAIPDWPSQLQALKLLFNADEIVVKYQDEEGDEIGIRDQKDYDYALELARSQLNRWLVMMIRKARGGQLIAETRVRVDKAAETPEEKTMSTAVQTALSPERQTNATQTADATQMSDQSIHMSFIESQFNKFKREIAEDIDHKLSMFMNQLRHSTSQSPVVSSLDSDHDFELTQHPDDSELAAKVSKMLTIRSEAEAVGRRLKLAYFEEELELSGAFNSEFIKDCNVPDGTQLRPNVKFEKIWMLKNTGRLEWSHEIFPVKLICVSGNIFVLNNNHVDVKNTGQAEIATVSVSLMTPSKPGSYFSEWRLSCNGYQFGPKIWCCIEVVDDATKSDVDINLTDLPTKQPTLSTATTATSFNNSTDSFEEVNTSSFHDHADADDDKNLEDDILVVPDCFNLDKEWKKRPYSSSTQSECNVEIFEDGLESRNDLTSTHADTSLDSSFCKELDSTIGKEETAQVKEEEEEETVVENFGEPQSQDTASSSSSETSPRKSLDEEVLKNVSGTIDLMKNAFKNLSGPSYVGYVCDLETNKPPLNREQLLKRIAQNYDQAPVKKELTSMETLMQMGFANRALNDRLLRAYNEDIQKVVHHLTQRSDNNWSH